jgi:hypothetical protein
LAAVTLVGAAVWLVRRGSEVRPAVPLPKPLAVVPAGPAFLLTLDLARLRATPAGLAVANASSRELSKRTGQACGFDPLRDVNELVVAVPANVRLETGAALPRSDAVAVIAGGRFVGPVVADCVARQIKARGGEPLRTTIGSFASVRDGRSSGEIAVRNGLLVLSDGAYLRLLLDAAEGHRPDGSAEERVRDRLHAELRRTFGQGAPLVATLALPEGWLENALGEPDVGRSPLSRLRSAALRAEVRDQVEIRALLACAGPTECEPVERFLRDARAELAPVFGAELAKRLAELVLERHAERIELSGRLDAAETRALFGISR